MRVSVTEAKGQLTELVRRAERGEEVVLTRHGQAAARIVPAAGKPTAAEKLALMQAIQKRAAKKTKPGPCAARSQDFLYDEHGLPQVIAVDTSALMAILLREPSADACKAALGVDDNPLISAGTLTEALIVAGARGLRDEMWDLVNQLRCEIVPVTADTARSVAAAHARWGRGVKTAGLNFGDCFAYDVAKQNRCPLLYVGRDFAKTDVKSVL